MCVFFKKDYINIHINILPIGVGYTTKDTRISHMYIDYSIYAIKYQILLRSKSFIPVADAFIKRKIVGISEV